VVFEAWKHGKECMGEEGTRRGGRGEEHESGGNKKGRKRGGAWERREQGACSSSGPTIWQPANSNAKVP
jgi:hypothetical protein